MPLRILLPLIMGLCAPAGILADSARLLEAGIPAVDREWLGVDYVRTAQILSSGKVALPRFSDKDESALLYHLISTNNFRFAQNRSLPLESRMEDLLNLQGAVNTVLKLYMSEMNQGKPVSKEAAHILGFLLRTCEVVLGLVEEFLPKIPKDEKYGVRMDGLKKMKSGLTTVFAGAELTLSETNIYSADDRSVVLGAMADTLPRIKDQFSDSYRIELRGKLKKHRTMFRAGDRKKIEGMVVELGEPVP